MKWKDILIGAIASLAVTVIGGIAVYYFTKEPDYKKTERIVYSVQQSASFKGGTQDVAFATVKIENNGGVSAKHVILLVTFNTAEIKDFGLQSSTGRKETVQETKHKSIQLTYDTILPKESVTLSLLLSSAEKPTVILRSDDSLGVEDVFDAKTVAKASAVKFLQYTVPVTGIILALPLGLVLHVLRSGGYFDAMASDKNNAGFLMLHHGFVDDATEILMNSIRSGRYDPFTLSNLATCKALTGQSEQAKQLIRAANFRNRSGHAKAVISFNEALICLAAGEKTEALTKLKEAVSIAPKHIQKYCQLSVHFDSIRNAPGFVDLLKNS